MYIKLVIRVVCIGNLKIRIYRLYFYTIISRLNKFFGTQYPFNLCGQVENIKWILCSPKICVRCAYLRFLIYKIYF